MKWLAGVLAVLAIWLLLFVGQLREPSVFIIGAVLAVAISLCVRRLYPEGIDKAFNLLRWLYLLIYLPYFLILCIRANLDVAVRVLHPDIPIRPGIVKVRTTLNTEMAKTFLANSITLTPGTLTVDIDGQDLYIHWINIDTESAEKRTAEICGRFEPLLRRIFE